MPKLFMLLIGCKPPGRHTEQHDIYFGIGETIKDLLSEVKEFWPEAAGKFHLDGWREINNVDGYQMTVINKTDQNSSQVKLFFINLGGYKPNEFEEFHYKIVTAATDKSKAISQARETAFFRHTGFEGANSHIDDKYGIDVDDLYDIEDLLNNASKKKFSLLVTPLAEKAPPDEIHLGYFKITSFI